MSKDQATIKAAVYNSIARTRSEHLSYRAEEVGKGRYAVIQYYNSTPVGIC